MNHEDFERIFDEQARASFDTLVVKGREYSPVDRFSNFKIAAAFQACSPKQALGGMLAKHIVSVYDLIRSDEPVPMEKWDEKLGDAINYLFLLKGLVVEEERERVGSMLFDGVAGAVSQNNVVLMSSKTNHPSNHTSK